MTRLQLDIGFGTTKRGWQLSRPPKHSPEDPNVAGSLESTPTRRDGKVDFAMESEEDAKAYILDNLPARVRDKIPNEAWNLILDKIERSVQ